MGPRTAVDPAEVAPSTRFLLQLGTTLSTKREFVTRVGRCNRRELDNGIGEATNGQFLTLTVFDDLGHPIAATRIDGGD